MCVCVKYIYVYVYLCIDIYRHVIFRIIIWICSHNVAQAMYVFLPFFFFYTLCVRRLARREQGFRDMRSFSSENGFTDSLFCHCFFFRSSLHIFVVVPETSV